MIDAFVGDEAPTAIAKLRGAVTVCDLKRVAESAHKLRGSLAMFGAHRLTSQCMEMEMQAKAGTLADPEAALALIEAELETVTRALVQLKERPS